MPSFDVVVDIVGAGGVVVGGVEVFVEILALSSRRDAGQGHLLTICCCGRRWCVVELEVRRGVRARVVDCVPVLGKVWCLRDHVVSERGGVESFDVSFVDLGLGLLQRSEVVKVPLGGVRSSLVAEACGLCRC